ncbi:uracil permease [Hypoxylon sp. FL1284]|nr:uracil permease [Hypoxylon sp. FL1284]
MDSSALRRRGRAVRERLTDIDSWKLPKQTSSIAPPHVWTNADQDPVPEDKRTWTKWAFIGYWYSDLVTVSTWQAAGAIMTTGLSATDAVLIVLVAAICNAIPTVLNGAIGADLHIPFPVAARASYGYWFSYFCIVTRGILALFWFGIQGANGGTCVTAIVTAVWPSYARLPNALPASAGTTTQGLLSYFIYWCIQLPLLLIPSHRLQYLFWAKTALVTPTALAMVVWITVKAGGGAEFFYEPATVSGSTRAWLWLANLTSVTGGYSTLAVNIPDFSRFSKTRGAQLYQLPFIPVFKTTVGVFGIVSAGASRRLWGELYWSPLDVVERWQGTPGGRAAAFFAGAAWLLAQVSVNVSANGVSFANDATTLAPRWLDNRRGAVLVALVGGWALCPWIVVASAGAFLSFMGAAAVFMAPVAAVLCCDFWLVKRRRYDVPALYDPDGIYRYGSRWGTNWRALAVTVVIIGPLLPAVAQKVAPQNAHISEGLVNLFTFNWLYGFFAAFALYYALNYFFPDQDTLIPSAVPGDTPVLRAVGDDDVESGGAASDEKKAGQHVKASPTSSEEVGDISNVA